MPVDRESPPRLAIVDPSFASMLGGAVPARVRPSWMPSPFTGDVIVALAVAAGAALIDLGPGSRAATAPIWDVALALPLVLRRRRPVHALVLVALVCLGQWLAGVQATGDVAFLVVLYSVGAHGRRWWTLAGAIAIAELGVVLALVRWGPAHNWLLPALTATGTVSACWVVGIYMRMRRDYVTSIRERAETAERERDTRAQIAVAAERARIAREMHDVIAHSLSVMITLNDAAAAVEPSATASEAIAQASEVGRNALGEMQRLLGVLRDDGVADHAPQPGAAEIPDLVSMVRASGLGVELAVTGDLASVPPTMQLALYRIVQESLTNVLKHARGVSTVHVELRSETDEVHFCVHDDGAPSAAPTAQPGHGLTGMDERARIFGGRLTAGPGPNGGWSVRGVLRVAEMAT